MLAFDHLVLASSHPAQEQKNFEEKYGIRGFRGGRHEIWGTYNYLSHLNNYSYLEWIGIEDAQVAQESDNPLIQQLAQSLSAGMQGPIQFALRTTEMERYLHYWDKESITYKGPFPGSRKKTDGTTLKWRMLFPEADGKSLPFLIEWEGSNRPDDASLINTTTFTSISTGGDLNLFEKIYRLGPPSMEDSSVGNWQLKNGTLLVKRAGDIRVKLEDILL